MKLHKAKGLNLLLLLCLYWLLNFTFYFVISKFYFVQRLQLEVDFDLFKFVLCGLIACLIIFIFSIIRIKPFIYCFLNLVITVQIFPALILIQYCHNDWRIAISPIIFFSLIILLSKIKFRIKTLQFNQSDTFKLLIVITTIGLIPFIFIYAPYIRFENLLLMNIYETRAEVNENITDIYSTYTLQWYAKFIIPAIVIFSIAYRKYLVLIGSILALIFLFLAGANKAIYFGIVMILLFSFGSYYKKVRVFNVLLILITIVGLLSNYFFEYQEILRYSIRRLIFIPPITDLLYFDFFDNNSIYWSESLLSPWIEYPYQQYHSRLIGLTYFGNEEFNANNGIFSDGFMNFGMMGVVINSTIVALVYSYFAQLRIHPKFFGLFFLLFISVMSSSLTTILVTHGMIFLMVFGQLFLKNSEANLHSFHNV